MKNKVVLITGGSRGIGAATALIAAKNGWDICFSYRSSHDKAETLLNKLRAFNINATAIKAFVGDESDTEKLFDHVREQHGRLDALVNNAGIIGTTSRLEHFDLERLSNMFNVNVIGSILCAREAIKTMSKRYGGQGGSIVNLSSAASRLGSPNEFIDYAASKGAIDTLTLGLSKEVAEEGIRVNAVRPGIIQTDLHNDTGNANRVKDLSINVPLKRAGSAEEVANAIYWLISDEASYVNGAIIDVAGGR